MQFEHLDAKKLLNYISTISKPLKHIKHFFKKHTTYIVNMKKQQSEIEPIKIGKKPGTTYCLGCKDFARNFRPQEVKTTNKVLREKSDCVVCQSNKSRFLKRKHNTRK